MKVGFVGLGAMGAPMARHLRLRSLLAAVYNRNAAKATSLAAELDVQAPAGLRELAALCNVIVTCISADADVLAVVGELAEHARPGLIVIDHSTVSADTARAAHARMVACGGDFLDAPVSGGVEGAKNGKLSIMVGGAALTLARVRPVLDSYATRIGHMGEVGAGQNTKAVNQVLIAGIAAAVCEGLALSEKLGLEADKLLPTLQAGAAACWFLDKRGATMLRDEFAVGFKLKLLHKDLEIVEQMAAAAGSDRSVVQKALGDYAELMARGHGDEDISALIRLKRRA